MQIGPFTDTVEDKAWGTTENGEMFGVQCSRITIKLGGFCSCHFHERKSNIFIVIEGILRVITYDRESRDAIEFTGNLNVSKVPKFITYRDLLPSDIITIDAGIAHRFFALTECKALEIYLGDDVDPDDIVRFDEGGCDELHDLRCD